MIEPLLTTAAASRVTGIARSTLEKLRVTGMGPAFHKLGRTVRYTSADLEVWLSARRVRSTSEPKADQTLRQPSGECL